MTLSTQEAFEKCWAHSPLRAAALRCFTLPFTRYRYCRTPPALSMSTTTTTTTTTTRDRGHRYGPIEWAQLMKSRDVFEDNNFGAKSKARASAFRGECQGQCPSGSKFQRIMHVKSLGSFSLGWEGNCQSLTQYNHFCICQL